MHDRQATPEQVKAVASPLRLRILRLCTESEWTNKELADRLERDPATILHHVRLLVDAGLLEPTAVRQGPSGAYEKPYRSTGLSWQLSFEAAEDDEETPGELAMLSAFRQELAEAGKDSIHEMTRFYLHLDEAGVQQFTRRFLELIEEYRGDDEARQAAGAPGHGGLFTVHRLADPSPPATPPTPGRRSG